MASFVNSAQRQPVGPGTLYAAPLGTSEPTSVSGAWPNGWQALGYTQKGNSRSFKPSFKGIDVDEEVYPLRQVVESVDISVTFTLAEITAANLAFVLNGGIGTGALSDITGTNSDGSVWVEPPNPGEEVHLMVGWDAIPKAATNDATGGGGGILGRSIYRQCVQTGEVKETRQKGANPRLYTVTLTVENPATGLKPFRDIFPASVAA